MSRKIIGVILGAVVLLSLVGFAARQQTQRPIPVDVVNPLTASGAVRVEGKVDVSSSNLYHLTVRSLTQSGQLLTILQTTNPPEVGQYIMLQASGTLRRAYLLKYIVHMPKGDFSAMEVQAYINENEFIDLGVLG
jgi:hypothetical protein